MNSISPQIFLCTNKLNKYADYDEINCGKWNIKNEIYFTKVIWNINGILNNNCFSLAPSKKSKQKEKKKETTKIDIYN